MYVCTSGFATCKSTAYADTYQEALVACTQDIMAQLRKKGHADSHKIISVLWLSENKQVHKDYRYI